MFFYVSFWEFTDWGWLKAVSFKLVVLRLIYSFESSSSLNFWQLNNLEVKDIYLSENQFKGSKGSGTYLFYPKEGPSLFFLRLLSLCL